MVRPRFGTTTMRWPRTASHNLACGIVHARPLHSGVQRAQCFVHLHVNGGNGAKKMSTVDVWFIRALGPHLSELERHTNWVCKDGVVVVSSSHPELASHRASHISISALSLREVTVCAPWTGLDMCS
jgi:hypothetical protein